MGIEPLKAEVAALLRDYFSEHEIETGYKARMLAFLAQEPDPFTRDNARGHFTASVWLLSADHTQVLLTEHAKLKRWFQLGGHIEPFDQSFVHACYREVTEESGIPARNLQQPFLIDLDIHIIPTNGSEPEHPHFDLTVCVVVDPTPALIRSAESLRLEWVPVEEIPNRTDDAALLRMVAKTRNWGLGIDPGRADR